MDTLGNYLREEREKQGRTLDDIARKTRISRTMLEAIEADQDTLLPPAAYLRGLLKLYARELGLSVEDVLAHMPQQTATRPRVALPRTVDLKTPQRPWLKICLALGGICIAGLWIWQAFWGFAPPDQEQPLTIVSPRPAQPDMPPYPAAQPDTSPGIEPADNSTVPAATEQAAPQMPSPAGDEQDTQNIPEPFSVKFAAKGIVWIKMQADERAPVDITLKKGESYRTSASRSLQARLGNPALVDVWYNDTPVALPDTPGVPLDVTFPDVMQHSAQPGQ